MRKYNCIIWGVGKDYNQFINTIKYYIEIGQLNIIGITAKEQYYSFVDGFPFLSPQDILIKDADFVIVGSLNKFLEIRQEIIQMNVPEEKILSLKVFLLPEFDLEKYLKIKASRVSIFSICCWGGLTYNRLGLEFNSPFINMYETVEDYLQLMKNLKYYLACPLEFECDGIEPVLKTQYPVCRLDNTLLHFNHYNSYEQAISFWNRRKERINWNNIFLMMYTQDFEEATRFIELPYKNKVCFVPFETNEKDLLYVDYYKYISEKNIPFWKVINGMATGEYIYYDVLDLLLGNNNNQRLKEK